MNHCSALLCVGILLLPPQILAATPDPRAEARVRSNNIILLEGDLLGTVRDVQQEVIQSEGGLERDLRITFDEHGQISAAWQGYGPNPLWQSQLDRDGWGGWISRSVVALQMGKTQSLSQQVCVYKRDAAGRITKATQVEAGNGTLGITRQYYVYTPDGRVRFYLSLGQSPGYGLYFYRPDGRLRLVIRHNGLSSSRFTADGRDLGGLTQTPFITYLMTCQRWDSAGNCRLIAKQEQVHAVVQGEERTLSTRYLLRQTLRYRAP
ncbi:hypothetical protein ACOGYQ_000907 [Edwardsiella piscicida]|uniref:hypothetical protein n=1 Tax=Edwardsiella piscicida TaxID=1263550 RepID=UPI000AA6F15C|nr:hypothetical protein [Edwardsiella piscicida]UBU79989.1 hypothetical protein A9797_17820 [Edwardsiella piscicida]UCQ32331.1 hypothetical protein DCF74_05825 [Edwardsiella piscicida]UCQ58652.1 hypothetical protein DCF40_05805 [Edwardsiella piscicida]WAM45768.1 hypothetical protein NMC32_05710 [Edwardsiella piscicida]